MTDVDNPNGRLRPRRNLSTTTNCSRNTRKIDRKSNENLQDNEDKSGNLETPFSAPINPVKNSFLCLYCERSFGSKKAISKHVQRVHNGSAGSDYAMKCIYCDVIESDSLHYVKHMQEKHPGKYFTCDTCIIRFSTSQELQDHLLNCSASIEPIIYKLNCSTSDETIQPYRNKLRHKTTPNPNILNKKVDSLQVRVNLDEQVISSDLKNDACDLDLKKDVDFEDNISMNLILPSCKSLCPANAAEKTAVIVLDDIQWKHKQSTINAIKKGEHTDQILSRLGVVHRSRGTETSRYWYKHIDESGKFECCFDTAFYLKVAKNVQENMLKFLDGTLNKICVNGEPIKTRKSKFNVPINTIEGFPSLLASGQFSRNTIDDLPRAIAPKQKWKWESTENDKETATHDDIGIIKADPHKNKCIVSLFSSLDIWTQLQMRQKYEKLHSEVKKIQNSSTTAELKHIIESRELPNQSTEIVKYTAKKPSTTENIEFPLSLGLVPSAMECEIKPAVLSGEWARKRCYVCCACGEQLQDPKSLSSHHSIHHPQAQVSHYEVVGDDLLNADILKHLYIPTAPPVARVRRRIRGSTTCTKCSRTVMMEDLHGHILACAGDTPLPRRKVRQKPFGVRRRRTRLPEKEIREQIRKNIRNRRNTRKLMRSRQKLRTEVGDAETIKKMIADLPAKRHRVLTNPSLSQRVIKRRENRLQIRLRRTRPEDDGTKSQARISTKSLQSRVTRTRLLMNEVKSREERAKIQKRQTHMSSQNLKAKITRKNILRRSQRKLQENATPETSKKKVTEESSSTEMKDSEENMNVSLNPSQEGIEKNVRCASGENTAPSARGGIATSDGNTQSGRNNTNNSKKSTPLKHSIESLTSTPHVESYRRYQLDAMHQKTPLSLGPPTFEPYEENQMFIQEKEYVEKLDKPPLCNKNDYYSVTSKSKLNRPRKGLNDCIAMLKGKLGESPTRSVTEQEDNPGYKQSTHLERKQYVQSDSEISHNYEQFDSYQPLALTVDYENSMLPLDLSGKSSHSSASSEPSRVYSTQISPLCLAPVQSEPLPLIAPAKVAKLTAGFGNSNTSTTTVFTTPTCVGESRSEYSSPKISPQSSLIASTSHKTPIGMHSSPETSLCTISTTGNNVMSTSLNQKVSGVAPSIVQPVGQTKISSGRKSKLATQSTLAVMESNVTQSQSNIIPMQSNASSKPTSVVLPQQNIHPKASVTQNINTNQSNETPIIPSTHTLDMQPSTLGVTFSQNSDVERNVNPLIISSQLPKKISHGRRCSDKSSKANQAKSCDKNRHIYNTTLKIPQFKARTTETDQIDQTLSQLSSDPGQLTSTDSSVALLPKEIVDILGTMSSQDRNKLLTALPQVFAKTVKDLNLVVNTNLNKECLLSLTKTEIATQTIPPTVQQECEKELLNVDTEKFLIDPVTGAIIERLPKENKLFDNIETKHKRVPRVDVIDLTEEEETEKKVMHCDRSFITPQAPECQDAEQLNILNLSGTPNLPPLVPPALVKTKGPNDKTASLRAVRIKSVNGKQKILNSQESSPLQPSQSLSLVNITQEVLETKDISESNQLPNARLSLETSFDTVNTSSMVSPAIQKSEISSTQQNNTNAASLHISGNNLDTDVEIENKALICSTDQMEKISESVQNIVEGQEVSNNIDVVNSSVSADNRLHVSNDASLHEEYVQNKDIKECSNISVDADDDNETDKLKQKGSTEKKLFNSVDEDDPEDNVSLAVIVKQKLGKNNKSKTIKKKSISKKSRKKTTKSSQKNSLGELKLRHSQGSNCKENNLNNESITDNSTSILQKDSKIVTIADTDIEVYSQDDTPSSPLTLRRSQRIKSVFVEPTTQVKLDFNNSGIPSVSADNKLPLTKKQLIFSKLLDEKKIQDMKDLNSSPVIINTEIDCGETIQCVFTKDSNIAASVIDSSKIIDSNLVINTSEQKKDDELKSTSATVPNRVVTKKKSKAVTSLRKQKNLLPEQKNQESKKFDTINGHSENLVERKEEDKAILTSTNSENCEFHSINESINKMPKINDSEDDKQVDIPPVVDSKKRKSKTTKGKKKLKKSENSDLINAQSNNILSNDKQETKSLSSDNVVNENNGKIITESKKPLNEEEDNIPVSNLLPNETSKSEEYIPAKKKKKVFGPNKLKKELGSVNKSEEIMNNNEEMLLELKLRNEYNKHHTVDETCGKESSENLCTNIDIKTLNDNEMIPKSLLAKENSADDIETDDTVLNDKSDSGNFSVLESVEKLQDDPGENFISKSVAKLHDNEKHETEKRTSEKNEQKTQSKRKRELESDKGDNDLENVHNEILDNSESGVESNDDYVFNNLKSELNFGTRRTRSKSMLFKTVTATSPQDFDIIGPLDEFTNSHIFSKKDKVDKKSDLEKEPKITDLSLVLSDNKCSRKGKKVKIKCDKDKKEIELNDISNSLNSENKDELIINKLNEETEIEQIPKSYNKPDVKSALPLSIRNIFIDSDDSSQSDVPLNKYVKESVKKEKENPPPTVKRVKGKAGPKSFIKSSKKTVNTFDNLKPKTPESQSEPITDTKTKSDQFMESFGFFSERKPRKSNLIAAKKIFETFHSGNDSDEVSYRSTVRTNKRNRDSKLFMSPDTDVSATMSHMSSKSSSPLESSKISTSTDSQKLLSSRESSKSTHKKVLNYIESPKPSTSRESPVLSSSRKSPKATTEKLKSEESLNPSTSKQLVPASQSDNPRRLKAKSSARLPAKRSKSKRSPQPSTSKDSSTKKRQRSFCFICKKSFQRADNFSRHLMSLLHASNLSAITTNCESNTSDQQVFAIFRNNLDNLIKLQRESGIPLENLPSLADIFKMTMEEKYGGKNFSQDEALFYECCALLKDSHINKLMFNQESIVETEEQTNADTSAEPTNIEIIEESRETIEPTMLTSAQEPKAESSTNQLSDMSDLSQTEQKSHEHDEDVDSITAREIMESEEVRNLENDLISNLRKRSTLANVNDDTLSSLPDTATPTGPYDFTSDDDTKIEDIRLSRFQPEALSTNTSSKGKEKVAANYIEKEPDDSLQREMERLQSLPSTSTGIYHANDLFEDKFDKIKRKCRSQAAAAKNAQLSLEPVAIEKPKKKATHKKSSRKQQFSVPTKGALKGFDGIKASISTPDVKPKNIVSEASKKKKKKPHSKKSNTKTPVMPTVMPKITGSNILPKSKVDVYEFMDDLDDNHTLELRPISISERIKSALKIQSHPRMSVENTKEEESRGSVSDNDDFVYMSDDYHCSGNETETENSQTSSEFTNTTKPADAKQIGSSRKDSTEKITVMGKIFKTNAMRNERRVSLRDVSQESTDRTNLDQLFDSLLEKEASPEKDGESWRAETPTVTPDVTEESFRAMQAREVGVAGRARRKCAVGKQNVLAETWSSESDQETHYGRSHGVDAASVSRKKKSKKSVASCSLPRKPKHPPAKESSRESGNERERGETGAAPSCSSEEESRALVEQHGWIVGHSHKKLVTMLAQAKRRKRDDKPQSD